jgi:hypothetical protein
MAPWQIHSTTKPSHGSLVSCPVVIAHTPGSALVLFGSDVNAEHLPE